MVRQFLAIHMLTLLPVLADPTVDVVLRRIDENNSITSDIQAKVVLTQQKVGEGTKRMDMMYYRRDADESFLIVMTAPESDKGNGYLRVEDNFWMYRRNTRTFQHINRDESIGGSDARGDDFERRNFSELYRAVVDSNGRESITGTTLGKIAVYRIDLIARVNDVDYPKKAIWVRTDNYLPLKDASYSLAGTLMQTAYFLKYTQIDGKYVPIKHMYIDEFEKGNKTIVEISGILTGKLDNTIFTKAYLENLSK